MERVYFDTSFFIGLLENQSNRRAEARRILEYESKNDRFTSQLTLNEFLIGVYDDFKDDPECDAKIEEAETQIRSIARVVAMDDDVIRKAALLQSEYGRIRKGQPKPKEPRDRGFRWDALHLATSDIWKCDRIYAWDGKWEALPPPIKTLIYGKIIAPAICQGLPFIGPEENTDEPGAGFILDASTEPPPPSGQSPVVSPASVSPPEPAPPSVPLAAPKPPQPPEAGPPAPQPLAVVPQSPSKEPRTEKLEN
jgi:predicted nucleic acid-binding protein